MSVPLHTRILGEGGVPVLLIHGLFGSGDNLGALARELAGDRTVVLVDLRNHGQSPHVDFLDLAAMADDILALQEKLGFGAGDFSQCGINQFDIVGHSLGGKVAMQLALNFPQAVRRLVVADIAPVAYAPGHDAVFAALSAVDLRSVERRGDADAMMAPYLTDLSLRQFLLKGLYRDEGGYHWRFNLPALKVNYAAIRAAPSGNPFTGPTLFIKGELSDYITAEHEPTLRHWFPNFEFRIIAGAGHWLHGEKPAEFNSLVKAFMSADD